MIHKVYEPQIRTRLGTAAPERQSRWQKEEEKQKQEREKDASAAVASVPVEPNGSGTNTAGTSGSNAANGSNANASSAKVQFAIQEQGTVLNLRRGGGGGERACRAKYPRNQYLQRQRRECQWLQCQGLGFRVWGSGFRIQGERACRAKYLRIHWIQRHGLHPHPSLLLDYSQA